MYRPPPVATSSPPATIRTDETPTASPGKKVPLRKMARPDSVSTTEAGGEAPAPAAAEGTVMVALLPIGTVAFSVNRGWQPPEHVADTARRFWMPWHGSWLPNCVSFAYSVHCSLPTHADVATAIDVGALQEGSTASALASAHVPVGVPYDAKLMALMVLPLVPQSRCNGWP